MKTFVDSSAWFAAANRKDMKNHAVVQLLREQTILVTSNFVVAETWLLINSRAGFKDAHSFWARMRNSPGEQAQVTPDDMDQAWLLYVSFADQPFSHVDLTSFVLMERLGNTRVVSFDDNVVVYRYGPGRSQVFEVLR